jgi:excisionase family DNA binding protein
MNKPTYKELDGTWGNDQAAAYLGCTPYTLRVWVSQRRVPYVKLGRLVRFVPSQLRAFVEVNSVAVEER